MDLGNTKFPTWKQTSLKTTSNSQLQTDHGIPLVLGPLLLFYLPDPMSMYLFKLFTLALPSIHLLDFCQPARAPRFICFAMCCHRHVAPIDRQEDQICGIEELDWVPLQKSRYGFIGSAVISKTFPGKHHKGTLFSQQQMRYTAASTSPSLRGDSVKDIGPSQPGLYACLH